MIKKILFTLVLVAFLSSCSSSKKVVKNNPKNSKISIADKIVWTAVTYKGVPYKFGGTTKKGMDCSGLIYTSFKQRGKEIPRVSHVMAQEGFIISLKEVKRGDLLFFKTAKTKNKVNHVGLVTSVNGEIKFIHATSSRGVIVSSLEEKYWKRAYVKAKRVL